MSIYIDFYQIKGEPIESIRSIVLLYNKTMQKIMYNYGLGNTYQFTGSMGQYYLRDGYDLGLEICRYNNDELELPDELLKFNYYNIHYLIDKDEDFLFIVDNKPYTLISTINVLLDLFNINGRIKLMNEIGINETIDII